ncbi:hypothetical protein [Bradyrhizobium acaciae]|nr:hypothetical protein [Bradyrhizobium acaciae]MCC8978039.1 hypothetical protein [Bradyrhizobium acaciae]
MLLPRFYLAQRVRIANARPWNTDALNFAIQICRSGGDVSPDDEGA